jgi:chemotaxis protein methyltransferase CheR
MRDEECVSLLRWALPRLGLRWAGFRRVRRQVCRRIDRRRAQLDLGTPAAYRAYLEEHPSEWAQLDEMCRIPISRFFRDRALFEQLGTEVLPELARSCSARGETTLHAWSAGCASGEEPYSLRLLWELDARPRPMGVDLAIVATDADAHMLERARSARYAESSLRALPSAWKKRAFEQIDALFDLQPEFRTGVELRLEDVRERAPDGSFELILCRNLAFTYFDDALQRKTLGRLLGHLRGSGFLVIGGHESLPEVPDALQPWRGSRAIYRRRP